MEAEGGAEQVQDVVVRARDVDPDDPGARGEEGGHLVELPRLGAAVPEQEDRGGGRPPAHAGSPAVTAVVHVRIGLASGSGVRRA
ncbi:hypothetical protein GCM10009836_38630 [Pseudonocardia ailaonensis]|uniref:Uncharacterized protein n=1 Tax=Pseudonocardia ailaonensis TaxID=367279 RepID=A0ABN2N694_9PSEU